MQYLTMTKDMTLSDLSEIVGERNVDYVLNVNGLDRTVNIGKSFYSRTIESTDIDYQKKLTILNQFVGDSDLYEKAALGTDDDWRTLAQYNCFTDAIKIPEEIKLPSSVGVLGNGEPITDKVYQACTESIKMPPDYSVDPSIFADYNAAFTGTAYTRNPNIYNSSSEPFQWFNLPWGEIFLYSSLTGDLLYFPVYPESIDDGYRANYEEMPEMLYQYEPWRVYKSSGPREINFTFHFHRDMWTGDHRDGSANDLIRGCQANCFPNYDGSLVNVALVTMYIHGQNFITGVMTDCKSNWKGPIGLDGFYLECELSLTISEVSPEALDYTTVRRKGLIG